MTSGGETGNAPQVGPCSFFATWAQVEACCNNLGAVEVETQELFLEVATLVAWNLTKQKYTGQCSRTINPCQVGCVRDDCCTCPQRVSFDLGMSPVWWAQVFADGVEIPVRIDDFRYVVRTDGVTSWPLCTTPWWINFTWGWPIPADVSMASAKLACEFTKQCQGLDCALDPRTTSYSREGVTVQIADPQSMISSGKTGIPMVDMLLGNPMHQRSGGIVDLAADVGYTVTYTPPMAPT